MLLTRWALLLVPLSVVLALRLSIQVGEPGTNGSPALLGEDKMRAFQILVVVAISGFASPPMRKVYNLLTVAIRIGIVLLILYIIALLGIQMQWWEPFLLGPIKIG